MKVRKGIVKMTRLDDSEDDGFVDASMEERIRMVWPITVALWSVSSQGKIHAESRLQRRVAKLSRRES